MKKSLIPPLEYVRWEGRLIPMQEYRRLRPLTQAQLEANRVGLIAAWVKR